MQFIRRFGIAADPDDNVQKLRDFSIEEICKHSPLLISVGNLFLFLRIFPSEK